jgi:large subunit ribosomal protein L30
MAKEIKSGTGDRFAVIRVRGTIRVKRENNETLDMLHLFRKNFCTIIERKDLGMVKKVKDYVTYGEINKETEDMLIKKRGEKTIGKDGKETIKRYFRLQPPKKGFGRKGIKVSFSNSGALGYRGEQINDLIVRML